MTQPHTSTGNVSRSSNPRKDNTWAHLSWVLVKMLVSWTWEQSSFLGCGSNWLLHQQPRHHWEGPWRRILVFIVTVSSLLRATCQTLVLGSHSAKQRFMSTAALSCYDSDRLQLRCILQLVLTIDITLLLSITDIWCIMQLYLITEVKCIFCQRYSEQEGKSPWRNES